MRKAIDILLAFVLVFLGIEVSDWKISLALILLGMFEVLVTFIDFTIEEEQLKEQVRRNA